MRSLFAGDPFFDRAFAHFFANSFDSDNESEDESPFFIEELSMDYDIEGTRTDYLVELLEDMLEEMEEEQSHVDKKRRPSLSTDLIITELFGAEAENHHFPSVTTYTVFYFE